MNSILLAAGLSKRMGVQKLLLPFGETTVIETVIENMHGGGLSPIIAVFSREVADAVQERPEWLRIGINNARREDSQVPWPLPWICCRIMRISASCWEICPS